MNNLKKELYDLCVAHVRRSMDAAELAISEAQKSSNDDTKSSAGDKYETGREMAQQETNRNLAQLNEANKLLVALNRIGTTGTSAIAEAGSVIITNNGNFYLAISAGALLLHGKSYFAVSPGSPVGIKLNGAKAGDSFTLNGKTYVVELVY
ncbi:3-oxoacyl-ACP synthase [Mucilaginibacter sp. KACC 22773]|jgi:transcription elongation GreA/GreB family factor|uniref:3-oxoacyl-ACP synthase n=1 Tax=Mucilaginibacter sp. KACC 22773 TaxID=3025671 RepID=UPI002366C2CF|nr:3-oxoacyl-ACP synthase [Mucilaginibacter sp. KACC 22773]WDF77931.1 3-oxoacyl-ACP synthase [Mucilaginibacter sp. KACC 22773]